MSSGGKLDYDPNAPGKAGSLYGLPYTSVTADCVIVPIPWDVTVSYHSGTRNGPRAILDASPQLDLEIKGIRDAWKFGLAMSDIPQDIEEKSQVLRKSIEPYIKALETTDQELASEQFSSIIQEVNLATRHLNKQIKSTCLNLLNENKIVGLLGGDHSTPIGLIQALGEFYGDFGILQLDAHMDLRVDYEGFRHSHASIMYNAIQTHGVKGLVQVGIRDYCQEEKILADQSDLITTYFDESINERVLSGEKWMDICMEVVSQLPANVYVSFDIDGLDPKLCPGTGTPVPGGLDFWQAILLIKTVVTSGRRIIGFDLCEVSPKENDGEWNANVGARVLYHLACWCAVSQGKLSTE